MHKETFSPRRESTAVAQGARRETAPVPLVILGKEKGEESGGKNFWHPRSSRDLESRAALAGKRNENDVFLKSYLLSLATLVRTVRMYAVRTLDGWVRYGKVEPEEPPSLPLRSVYPALGR